MRSSGIQILPALQPIVNQLTTFVREPTWISPPFGTSQRTYSIEEKQQFANNPSTLTTLRKVNETNNNSMLSIYFEDHEKQAEIRADFTQQMKDKLASIPWLQPKLIPGWAVGCRRLTPGIGYLETLSKPNVKVVFGEIDRVSQRGCVCDGVEYPVDVLICATGFVSPVQLLKFVLCVTKRLTFGRTQLLNLDFRCMALMERTCKTNGHSSLGLTSV
jgi:cation diffusion facilitator CzcD-associated flavoprotein CzcO